MSLSKNLTGPIALGLALSAAAVSAPAGAAESYDSCVGYIDSVPAVISTQGVWCMRADLSTAIETGIAIRVDANNVTIDCNDFKLGGLAAGADSGATGISATSPRANVTVRRCNIRGFFNAVAFAQSETSGLIVEHNRFDGNLVRAVLANGDGHVIRGNRIADTGGTTSGLASYGIQLGADNSLVEDNQVTGVYTDDPNGWVYGIYINGQGNIIRGNRVSNLVPDGNGSVRGVELVSGGQNLVEGNVMINSPAMPGFGVHSPQAGHLCVGNRAVGFTGGVMSNCFDGGGNVND